MKDSMSQDDIIRYKNLIISFVNNAIIQTDGVAKDFNVIKSKLGVTTLNTKNIHVYFVGNEVIIDIYINVIFGYSVPHVVYLVQDKIINSVKESTEFDIKSVNVNVSNVIFM